MEKDINKRIKKLIEEILKITPYEFSKNIGNNRPDGLYRILNNEVSPSPKTLEKIFEVYPKYKVWLLTGEGEMLNNHKTIHDNNPDKKEMLPWLKKELDEKTKIIDHFIKEIDEKREEIKRLQSELEMIRQEFKKKELIAK